MLKAVLNRKFSIISGAEKWCGIDEFLQPFISRETTVRYLHLMGAFTSNRKRVDNPFCTHPSVNLSNFNNISKKQKVSQSMNLTPDRLNSSKFAVSRYLQYPETKGENPRVIHAPTRNSRFKVRRKLWSGDFEMGNSFTCTYGALNSIYVKRSKEALDTIRHVPRGGEEEVEARDQGKIEVGHQRDEKGKKVIDLVDKETATDESSIEELETIEVEEEGPSVVSNQRWKGGKGVMENIYKIDGKGDLQQSSSALVTDLSDVHSKVFSLSQDSGNPGEPGYKKLLDSIRKAFLNLPNLSFEIQLTEKFLQRLQSLRSPKKAEALDEDKVKEAFTPLTEEDEEEVKIAFSKPNRKRVLVTHKNSNIDITGEMLQCLRPGAWLNDEVINVYLELLKERENREPSKFLKCHFFNTFFYKKLIGGRAGYNFQAVRRWTSLRKLGYSLFDCDKIFVPIHKEAHWCLAVINKKDNKFQYLDSLRGKDDKVMKVLARYYVDEVKDKTEENIDVGSWGREFVEDLPEQNNGFDCGVFMIKYTDFYSRGVGLSFNQGHMPYFRRRTAKEILSSKAE